MKDENKTKLTRLVVAIVLLASLVMSVMPTYAANQYDALTDGASDEGSGTLDIALSIWQVDEDGTASELGALTTIGIGDTTSYMPIVTNCGEDCYMRLKLYAWTGGTSIDITTYLGDIDQDDWTMSGGYLYLTETFESGASVVVCQNFEFPEEWDYRTDKTLTIYAVAEAVTQVQLTVATISSEVAAISAVVATGDNNMLLGAYIGLAIGSIGLAAVLIIRRRLSRGAAEEERP